MKKRGLSILIALLMVAIIVVIIIDYTSQQPDKLGTNPYEFNVDDYRVVDPALITYRETRNFPVRGYQPEGIHIKDGIIWLTGNEVLQAVTTGGVQQLKTDIDGTGTCIHATENAVFIGFTDHVKKYSLEGELIATWEVPGVKCVFTSLAANDQVLYVADAGNRTQRLFRPGGEQLR